MRNVRRCVSHLKRRAFASTLPYFIRDMPRHLPRHLRVINVYRAPHYIIHYAGSLPATTTGSRQRSRHGTARMLAHVQKAEASIRKLWRSVTSAMAAIRDETRNRGINVSVPGALSKSQLCSYAQQ